MDDAGGAEDRQPTNDAEARIPGLFRQSIAAGNGDFDFNARSAQFGDDVPHHLARHRVDGGLAGRNGKPGLGDHADARPGLEADSLAALAHCRHHHAAMGDIGIVTRILDDSGAGPAFALLLQSQWKGWGFTLGQCDGDRIGEFTRAQCRKSCLHCRGCACARRPAAP